LSSIERLYLALFIATKHESVLRRVQIEAHDRLEFFRKPRIVTDFEGVDQVRLGPFLCQMRRTLASLIPTASAMLRVDHCVAFFGFSFVVYG
jgi:hypothetical protein